MRYLPLLLLVTASLSASNDRIYLGTSFSTEIVDNLEIEIAPEWRSDPEDDIQLYHLDLSLSYEPIKRLKIGVGYRNGVAITDGESFDYDRYNLDTKYTFKWNEFSTQLRVRYTSGHDEDGDKKQYLRYRLKQSYEFKKLHLSPFVSYEFYDNQNHENGRNRHIYSLGLSYEFKKHHTISAEYRWVDRVDTSKDYNISQFGYSFKF